MLIIPEFILLDALEKGLEFVRTDFENNSTDETKTYLYEVLGETSIGRYDYYKQAKKVFLAEQDDPRALNIDLMYNMDVSKVPSIYIALAAEQNGQNGLGLDEGFREGIVDDEEKTFKSVFNRRYNTSYSVMIMSDNSNEVVMIYHFLRALLISLHVHLNLKGVENISLGGQDLQLYDGIVPKNIFMRSIGVNIQYEVSTPDLRTNPIVGGLLLNGNPIEEITVTI